MADKKAFLIIDMLNDFVKEGAPLEVPAARGIVPNIAKRMKDARNSNTSVIYLCDSHGKDDPEFKAWPRHAVKGTAGSRVIDELKPEQGDIIIPKTSYSGFYNTDLNEKLKSLDVDELIITGCVTNICVLYTSVDALMRGYYVKVPEDCVAALERDDHLFALKQINKVLRPRTQKQR